MHNGKPGESRKGSDNLIHKYIFRDKPVVIDVNSGAVHMVDPVIYDALDFYRDKTCDKTAMEAALVPKYGAEALAEACSDIRKNSSRRTCCSVTTKSVRRSLRQSSR